MNDVALRSVLYVPADNARALAGAGRRGADVLLVDLEDPVAPDAKVTARDAACEAVPGLVEQGCRVVLRCNHLSTTWGRDDLVAARDLPVTAICVPKVVGPEDIDEVVALTGESGPAIWSMVETPEAMLGVREVAAHPSVTVLVMGLNDLSFALRVEDRVPGRWTVLPHLCQAVLAARAEGVAIVDGAGVALDDPEGFRAECEQGRALGFDGKTLIHPSQVPVTNEVWSPTPGQVEDARRVAAAWDQSEREGRGVAVVDGRMIETMHVARAREILARAGVTDAPGGAG